MLALFPYNTRHCEADFCKADRRERRPNEKSYEVNKNRQIFRNGMKDFELQIIQDNNNNNRKDPQMKKALLLLLAGWMFVLLIWVQAQQSLTSVKHDQQYVKQMQLETRARVIAKYGEYYD